MEHLLTHEWNNISDVAISWWSTPIAWTISRQFCLPNNNNHTTPSVPNWLNQQFTSLTNNKYRSTCKLMKSLVKWSRSSYEAGLAANAKRNQKGSTPTSRDSAFAYHNVHKQLSALSKHKSLGQEGFHPSCRQRVRIRICTYTLTLLHQVIHRQHNSIGLESSYITTIYKKASELNFATIGRSRWLLCYARSASSQTKWFCILLRTSWSRLSSTVLFQRRSSMTNLLESLDHFP